MALLAREVAVGPGVDIEGVIKGSPLPSICIVTAFTSGGEPRRNMAWIRGPIVIRKMADRAIRGNSCMTEIRTLPRSRAVTVFARRGKPRQSMLRVRGAVIV